MLGKWRLQVALLVVGLVAIPTCGVTADEIVAAAPLLQQRGTGTFVYRLGEPATDSGFLDIEWSDVLGRVVDRRRVSFALAHGSEIPFRLDLTRAVTAANAVRARLVFTGAGKNGAERHRGGESRLAFSVRPSVDPWSDYHAIMWQTHRAEQCAALKDLGIDAGMVLVADKDDPTRSLMESISPLTQCGRSWYVENIATDFYSAYHRWTPDHPVNWRFTEIRKAYQKNPQDLGVLTREPSLSDPIWQQKVRDRLIRIVRAHYAYRPLFYNLADEPGIADLSALWDFDFSSASLADMRRWLKAQYGSLAALNRQWGSHFADWNAVMPMTTAQAMARSGGNFSPWADFKAWMDVAFARAVRMGKLAVHAADPTANAAIEGGQIPGWGGYDYSRLAAAVDVMELYDGGGNVELVRGLNPKLIMLTTSAEAGPREVHDVWRELLRGSRGVILWDPKNEIIAEDGSVGARGRALAAPLREIKAGLGALLLHSRRTLSPIAILYSPPSMRTQWMLDWRPKGSAWSERDEHSYYEDESAVRSSMSSFLGLMQHLGLESRVVVPELVERGALRRNGLRVLILPRAISLSRGETAEIRRFVAAGGTVIADGEPGLYDQHSRRLAKPLLSSLFRTAPGASRPSFPFGKGRGIYFDPDADAGATARATAELRARDRLQMLRQMFIEAGVAPIISITHKSGDAAADIESYQWRNGATAIIALQHDQRGEPVDADGAVPETSLARGEPIVLTLPHRAYVYDLRQKKLLGRSSRIELVIDPIVPTILGVSETALAFPSISGPRRVRVGGTATVKLGTSSAAAMPVLHIDVIDPLGKTVARYSGNSVLVGNLGAKRLPFAFNDTPGRWQIRATDLVSGKVGEWDIEVVGH